MRVRMRWTWANIAILAIIAVVAIPFMAYGFEWLIRQIFRVLEVVVCL